MDCDRVFNILTAGPFPTGTELDDGVEAHLSDCEACRSLSEALRPAPDLFHESLTPSENRDLPIYHAMSMTSSAWQKGSLRQDKPLHFRQAKMNRPTRSSETKNQNHFSTDHRWSNMVSSVEIGQRGDITAVVTFVSLLAITMFSLGWIVQ